MYCELQCLHSSCAGLGMLSKHQQATCSFCRQGRNFYRGHGCRLPGSGAGDCGRDQVQVAVGWSLWASAGACWCGWAAQQTAAVAAVAGCKQIVLQMAAEGSSCKLGSARLGWVRTGCRLGVGWVQAGCRLGVGWVQAGCGLGVGWV